jgi:hypothetical protein
LTRLPNGRTQFIVFKPDMVSNAPEKVVVRVVAQIVRAARKREITTNDDGDTWTIRETSYEMKVAPIDGHRAMLLVRPPVADFAFPAGRYVLLLKSVAYDFSIDGPIADLAQCVERTDETGTFSVQCRN